MSLGEYIRKDGVVVVQRGVVDEIDEELRVAGVAAAGGQPDGSGDVAGA